MHGLALSDVVFNLAKEHSGVSTDMFGSMMEQDASGVDSPA